MSRSNTGPSTDGDSEVRGSLRPLDRRKQTGVMVTRMVGRVMRARERASERACLRVENGEFAAGHPSLRLTGAPAQGDGGGRASERRWDVRWVARLLPGLISRTPPFPQSVRTQVP